jgi:hypothetical protein
MMADNTRTSLWVAAAAVVGGLIIWTFSFSGAEFASLMLSTSLWLEPNQRGSLLAAEAAGLLVAFLLALLAVRRWSAPRQLCLGALAASVLLGGRYIEGAVVLSRIHAPEGWHNLFYSQPFLDPFVALVALIGLPLVVGLACWLALRRHTARVTVPEADEAAHA